MGILEALVSLVMTSMELRLIGLARMLDRY